MSGDQAAELARKMRLAGDTEAAARQALDVADSLVILLRDALASACRPALTTESPAVQRAAHEAWQAARAARELAEAFVRQARAETGELARQARELAEG